MSKFMKTDRDATPEERERLIKTYDAVADVLTPLLKEGSGHSIPLVLQSVALWMGRVIALAQKSGGEEAIEEFTVMFAEEFKKAYELQRKMNLRVN
jgi:hypothetical protein